MYRTRIYNPLYKKDFAEFANYNDFYEALLQKVKIKWNRMGNDILNLSDSKVSRLFSGKQKDIEILIMMAEFMQMKFIFNYYG